MTSRAVIEEREVTATKKDKKRNITALCNSDEPWWSPQKKSEAIIDIENGYRYFVLDAKGNKVDVKVVAVTESYLRTNPDWSLKNNLDDLPNC